MPRGRPVCVSAVGPLPLPQNRQGMYPSELCATPQVLRSAMPSFKIYARAHCNLWREFCFPARDLGGLGPRTIQIIQRRAQATRAQRREIGERPINGNRFADECAKKGANLCICPFWQRQAHQQKYTMVADAMEFA
eukprot:1393570-Pyramimonas_sp.AAC.1